VINPPKFEAGDEPSKFKAADKPPKFKAGDKPPKFKAVDKPPKFKAGDKPSKFKAGDKPFTSRLPNYQVRSLSCLLFVHLCVFCSPLPFPSRTFCLLKFLFFFFSRSACSMQLPWCLWLSFVFVPTVTRNNITLFYIY
jgi:hypothetical protein